MYKYENLMNIFIKENNKDYSALFSSYEKWNNFKSVYVDIAKIEQQIENKVSHEKHLYLNTIKKIIDDISIEETSAIITRFWAIIVERIEPLKQIPSNITSDWMFDTNILIQELKRFKKQFELLLQRETLLNTPNPTDQEYDYQRICNSINWKKTTDIFIQQIANLIMSGIIEVNKGELVIIAKPAYAHIIALFEIWANNSSISLITHDDGRYLNRNKLIKINFKYRNNKGEVVGYKTRTLVKIRADETYKHFTNQLSEILTKQ